MCEGHQVKKSKNGRNIETLRKKQLKSERMKVNMQRHGSRKADKWDQKMQEKYVKQVKIKRIKQ